MPVGYGKVKFPSGHALLDARAPAQLQRVYVLSEYIAHGVGSALLQEPMAEGARAGGDTIWLNVLSANARAIRFYERQGWTSLGEATFTIGTQSFDFLTMQTLWRG